MSNAIYLAGVATLAAVVTAYVYQKKKREVIPWKWEEVGVLKEMNIYPLKSGRRLELKKAVVTEFGLKQTAADEHVFQMRDRCLVVYGERDHEFRTARTYPKLMLVDVSVHDGKHLAIDAPSSRTLYVQVPTGDADNRTQIKLHGKETTQTIDCGDEAAQWFSRYLLDKDTGLRLGYNDGSVKRDVRQTSLDLNYYKNLTNSTLGLYSDLSSILLVNQASVDDLNKKLGEPGVSSNNFRPNLVVEGLYLEPFAEDHWEWVKIGEVILRSDKECTRCIMTTVDPDKGVRRSDMEPLNTLKGYRISNGPDNLPIMGINYGVRQTGTIAVGDRVFVSKSGQ